MAKKKSKKFNKMDFFLLIDLILIIAFTITMLVIYMKTYSVPDSVVIAVYGILGSETGLLAYLKQSKEREITRRQELEDRKYYEKINKGVEDNGIN